MKKMILGTAMTALSLQALQAEARIPSLLSRDNVCSNGNVLQNTLGTIAHATGFLNLNSNLFSVEVLPGLQLRGGIDRAVHRVAETDVFVRRDIYHGVFGYQSDLAQIDRYLSGDRRSLLTVAFRRRLPLSLEFNRFFHDPCEAAGSHLENVRDLPFDTERALRMARSEYFKVDASSDFSLTPEFYTYLGGSSVFGLEVQAGPDLSFSYQAHVVRLDGNKIKLRLIGMRLPDWSASVRLGPVNPIQFTDVRIIDRRLTRIFNLDFFQGRFTVTPRGLTDRSDAIEMTLDLSDTRVATAYNRLMINFANMSQLSTMQKLRLLTPVVAFTQFQNLIEDVSNEVRQLGLSDPASVQTQFDISTQGTERRLETELGYVIGRRNTINSSSSTQVTEANAGQNTYFHVTNLRSTNETRTVFNTSHERREANLDVVFTSNREGSDYTLNQIVFTVQALDKHLAPGEFRGFLADVRRNVTQAFYQIADQRITNEWFGGNTDGLSRSSLLSRLYLTGRTYEHSNLSYQVIINAELLRFTRRFNSVDDSRAYINNFLQSLDQQGIGISPRMIPSSVDALRAGSEINELSAKLYELLSTQLTDNQREEILQSLANNSIFMRAGPGLIIGLVEHLPEEQLKQLLGFQIVLRSSHLTEPLTIQWDGGITAPNTVVNQMLDVRSYMDRDGRDLERLASGMIQ